MVKVFLNSPSYTGSDNKYICLKGSEGQRSKDKLLCSPLLTTKLHIRSNLCIYQPFKIVKCLWELLSKKVDQILWQWVSWYHPDQGVVSSVGLRVLWNIQSITAAMDNCNAGVNVECSWHADLYTIDSLPWVALQLTETVNKIYFDSFGISWLRNIYVL